MWSVTAAIRESVPPVPVPPRLNCLAAADAVIELGRSRGRIHAEFTAQRARTGVILPKGQLYLALTTVTAHQPAMGILPAIVAGKQL